MDSIGIVAMGFGSFLMFQAIKNKQPTPIKHARDLLKRSSIPPNAPLETMQPITTTA